MPRKRFKFAKKINKFLKKTKKRIGKKAVNIKERLEQLFLHANKVKKILPKKKRQKRNAFLGIVLISLGLLILINPLSRVKFPQKAPSSQVATESKNEETSTISPKEPIKISKDLTKNIETLGEEVPARIIIPKLNIDLPVVVAKVIDGYWEISETSASFGLGSAFPGDGGNSVIFAHGRDNMFGPLKRVKAGDKIYVLTKRHNFTYEVSETKTVFPNQVETVAPTKDERLTLFTCSGFLDNQRLIVVAKRI